MPSHEIVIIDDASKDGTPEFIKERYSIEIERGALAIYCLRHNVGVSGAKNIGYQHSSGNWVIFLDSDDYYEVDSGKLIEQEINQSADLPIIFFRCRTHTGEFVGEQRDKRFLIDLKNYLQYTSFGEALTAVNKALVGLEPPYIQSLRGYEGIGCARLIDKFGHARLSSVIARIYVTEGDDRLSVNIGFLLRMPLLAEGHLLMIREFWHSMEIKKIFSLFTKAIIYSIVGRLVYVFVRK